MTLLLLETATDVCSVAVARNGVVVAERTAAEAHKHSTHLTLFVQEVMARAQVPWADVEAVVLSDGPGSYTSLRVGAATAKGLCLALPHLELRTVSTLRSLANAAPGDRPVLATLNSRRGEVYGQLFPSATEPPTDHPLYRAPRNIRLLEPDWWTDLHRAAAATPLTVTGPGQARLREHLPPDAPVRFAGPQSCAAALLLPLALDAATYRIEDVASYEPFYLNPPFVTRSKKKLLG